VPLTVVNRGQGFLGALPEQQFVAAAMNLAGVPDSDLGKDAKDAGPAPEPV
jgi:hypothetical protein